MDQLLGMGMGSDFMKGSAAMAAAQQAAQQASAAMLQQHSMAAYQQMIAQAAQAQLLQAASLGVGGNPYAALSLQQLYSTAAFNPYGTAGLGNLTGASYNPAAMPGGLANSWHPLATSTAAQAAFAGVDGGWGGGGATFGDALTGHDRAGSSGSAGPTSAPAHAVSDGRGRGHNSIGAAPRARPHGHDPSMDDHRAHGIGNGCHMGTRSSGGLGDVGHVQGSGESCL